MPFESCPKAINARLLKQRCIDVAAAFSDQVRRWSLTGPVGSWPAYRSEALMMADRIDHHLVQELADVQALLSGVERTRKP